MAAQPKPNAQYLIMRRANSMATYVVVRLYFVRPWWWEATRRAWSQKKATRLSSGLQDNQRILALGKDARGL
jgi:hypothetical protein